MKCLALTLLVAVLSTRVLAAETPPPAPAAVQLPLTQPLAITLPVSKWIGVIQSVQNSPVLSARDAGEIVTEINRQYQTAVAQAQTPKK